MTDANNYPSCIKIPNSKQNTTSTIPKFDMKEALAINDEFIALANRQFGVGKWSHSITNQTLDFVESFMGKYVCGCVTFLKIQLSDGTFHEDMGYCYAEGTTKGLSIHHARISSLTDAFKKVLLCFGGSMDTDIPKIIKKCQKVVQRQDSQSSIASIQSEVPEPCAQSTPYITRKTTEQKEKTETRPKSPSLGQQSAPLLQNIAKLKDTCHEEIQARLQTNKLRPKSPSNQPEQISVHLNRARSKSPNNTVQPVQVSNSSRLLAKDANTAKGQTTIESTGASHTKDSLVDIAKVEQEKKTLTDEELQRLERKRKQMEKQAEYKRQMKEKMLQKCDHKKPNPKY